MRIPLETVAAALEQHRRWYAERDVAPWDFEYHLRLWQTAHAAFEKPSFEEFEKLYDELRS